MHINFIGLQETFNELLSDVELAKKLDTDFCSEDFIKRTYTRAFFAMIEGVIFQLKEIALVANEQTEVFNPYEIELLKEKSGYLASNGEAKEKKAKLQFMPNIIFSVNSVAKALQLNHLISKSGEYNAMLDAIKIRDRITHPKNKNSIVIDDNDMIILGNANIWFRDEVTKLLNLMHEKHEVI